MTAPAIVLLVAATAGELGPCAGLACGVGPVEAASSIVPFHSVSRVSPHEA